MPTLADYKCPCGNVFEEIAGRVTTCPECGGVAHRIITIGSSYRDDAPWIATVHEVVDKDGREPETRAFLADPTRSNWKAWMKARGLRPYEEGEQIKRKEPDRREAERAIADKLMQKHRDRKALDVRW